MGCTFSKESSDEDKGAVETAFEETGVKPTGGPPSELYPFVLLNDGKLKEIGSGGYSNVYEATNLRTRQTVAVKMIPKSDLRPHDHDAFKSEVEILHECKGQANILAFVDYFDEKDHYYLVTEQITGGELFERICKKDVYGELDARNLVKALLGTLAFLHGKSIAHRDIKPENLLLRSADSDTQVVLAHFGFATKCDGKSLKQICGTPDYVAPEILMHALYDFKCDIWSAGVIAYILLGGYAPFQARNPEDREELFNAIKRGKLVFHERYWKDVSSEAKDCISQMLNVNPDARPMATDLLRHEWMVGGAAARKHRGGDLSASKARLKEFNARRKLKGAINAVKASNKMKFVLSAMKVP